MQTLTFVAPGITEEAKVMVSVLKFLLYFQRDDLTIIKNIQGHQFKKKEINILSCPES